jgi:hypothetical protein
VVEESRQEKLNCFITNNMCDETKLPIAIGRRAPKKRRVLAWHGQATWVKPGVFHAAGGVVMDADVIRPPQLLGRYTAATQWNLMAKDSDTTGLRPCGDALPDAEYHSYLLSGDSHAVNILTSKHVVQKLGPKEFHLLCLCMQHRTGSVCEEVANRWGLLPGTCGAQTQIHPWA